ncbi:MULTISPECIES: hypothetical protein [Xanthomonas]|nr:MULTISPECIES: hypothetical protein [Xanthomonas]MBB4768641.1 hypothetical protein [Xanthomonas arboricola]
MTEILITLAVFLAFGLFAYSRYRKAKASTAVTGATGGGSKTDKPRTQIR